MTTSRKTRSVRINRLELALACVTVLLALFMFVPVYTALSAGLSSVSLVVFGVATLVLGTVIFFGNPIHIRILKIALGIAVLACLIPQLAFLSLAHSQKVQLSFNPLSYLHFSGTTTIEPAQLITYKTVGNQSLKLALYPSKPPGARPVVVLLHGGGWRYGSHLETGKWPRILNEAGFSVISIEYRLSNDRYHTWRDAPEDVHDAITYLKTHASSLSIDPSQIHLLGQSAGGQLALLYAYRFNDVSSVVSLYAPADLTLDYKTSRDKSAELDFLGGPPTQYPARYQQASPRTYISSKSPRSFIIQGERDDLVSTQNAVELADTLANNNVTHKLLLIPMTGHSFENQSGGFATQIAEQSVINFLR